ncbi:kelch repeat and BTB domain-containing protein 12-like [Physella acuta]|uniref:kelch repeat and BTB domain-containing protein 12-like n=1 Tax=Physella acuta TaxID=109671 RepID=UPI0027DCEC6F|nr:kelch repeat and BTB domain-containing protein 12-like [Physella acuta]
MAVSEHLAKAVVNAIDKQLNNCTYHDVTVTVEGTEFQCHRFLLSASSKFFRALFQSGMRENQDRKVELKQMTSETFGLVLDCIYKAKNVLSVDNVSDVWQAANQLQIDFLLEACELFQIKRLSKDSCIEINIEAKHLDSKKLLELSWDVLIKDFDYLRKTDDILYLDFEDMKRLVTSDDLEINSEDVVIDLILRWAEFIPQSDERKHTDVFEHESKGSTNIVLIAASNEKEKDTKEIDKRQRLEKCSKTAKNEVCDEINKRKNTSTSIVKEDYKYNRLSFVHELLSVSKIGLISGACFQKLLDSETVSQSPEAFAIVKEALGQHLKPSKQFYYCPPQATHRPKSLLANVVITIVCDSVFKMSCRTNDGTWYQLQPPQIRCTAVGFEESIYVLSNFINQYAAYRYNPNTNIWTNIVCLNPERNNCQLVSLDNYIYAIGGDNSTSIDRFNAKDEQQKPGSGKWEKVGDLKMAVTNMMATTVGNSIVVFGSEAATSTTTTVQSFNTHTLTSHFYTDNMSGVASNMVSFKDRSDTYVLQQTGALWKLAACNDHILKMEFCTVLFEEKFKLSAALIQNEELLLLGTEINPIMHREWDTSHLDMFKRIKIIERPGCCLLSTVIPKSFLVTLET